jgi:DNA-binding SARP family transcriptional activator
MLEVQLLGKFEMLLDGNICNVHSRPAQSLLAFLLLNSGTPHRREKLSGLLWPDAGDSIARRNLRQALWQLRSAAGDSQAFCLQSDMLTITFTLTSSCQVDAAMLKNIPPQTSTEELTRILSVYKGELLPGFYEDWVTLEREHLQSIYDHNMGLLLERLVDTDHWHDILNWGETWIAFGNIPEPAYRALMLAHKALGDLPAMQDVYRRCQRAMQRDLGIQPSKETRNLHDSLLKDTQLWEQATIWDKFTIHRD